MKRWVELGSSAVTIPPPATFGSAESLVQKFASVFATPATLPPLRSHDHRIKLRLGTSPISVRPYRYLQS